MAEYQFPTRIEGPVWLEEKERAAFEARTSEVEEEIQSLEAEISELQHRKAAKLVERSSLDNTLAPVRRVPQEILSKIFSLFCLSEFDDTDSPFPNIQQLAQSIGTLVGVGIAWKSAAHATPSLWSAFTLDSEDIWVNNTWIEQWLSLSQGHPLDLALDLIDARVPASTDRATHLVQKILQVHPRLRSLHLEGDILVFLPFFHLSRDAMPLLEELHLSVECIGNDSLTQPMSSYLPHQLEAFGGSSNLIRLKVDDCEKISILERLAVPLEGLKSLQLSSYDPDINPAFYLRALSQCCGLENLEIYLTRQYRGTIPIMPFTLPSLNSLEIHPHNVSGDHGFNLLSSLSAPRLKSFRVHFSSFNYDAQLSQISDFHSRSGFSLESLSLDLRNADPYFTTDHLHALLSLFPTATSLCIHFPMAEKQDLLSAVLQALAIDESTGPGFLLRLVELELVAIGADDREYPSQLTHMILSRLRSHLDKGVAAIHESLHVAPSSINRLEKVTLRGFKFSEDMNMLHELPGLYFDYKYVT
ncbi:hypothetical protein D9757_011755 [Collybiopsis confluens]|uniref:F-box domain-containing protein n=1 Tax=Collybiopsis confluens TaxID=2823264 RepID=A0A8H5LPY4_9AGAR|nr:hypothetical protein D9757_011755 [Collybiopsis confluens]